MRRNSSTSPYGWSAAFALVLLTLSFLPWTSATSYLDSLAEKRKASQTIRLATSDTTPNLVPHLLARAFDPSITNVQTCQNILIQVPLPLYTCVDVKDVLGAVIGQTCTKTGLNATVTFDDR